MQCHKLCTRYHISLQGAHAGVMMHRRTLGEVPLTPTVVYLDHPDLREPSHSDNY
jgi:hypothetical protein